MQIDEARVRAIVEQVVKQLGTPAGATGAKTPVNAPDSGAVNPPATTLGRGVFADIDEAVAATEKAQREWIAMPVAKRKEVVEAVRRVGIEHGEMFSRETVAETGMGRVADKIAKHRLASLQTPGFEDLVTTARSGDHGLTIEEMAPYGVIAAVTPSTHPVPTMINNTICNLVAGNGVVFNGHPAGKRVFAHALQVINEYVVAAGGPANIITTVAEPTIEGANKLFHHPAIKLILVTGGPGVVKAAMGAGKKVIAAGPGNPPVVVDETADIEKAARSIIAGATFDCNLLCIAEKEIFVVDTVADELKRRMVANGAFELTTAQIQQLTSFVFKGDAGCAHPVLNRDAVGRDADTLAKAIGLSVPSTTQLLIGETTKEHPFVQHEQMTSFVPIVRCRDVHQAIEWAYEAEHGFGHTAIMHSKNVENMDKMAKVMNTTIFVKNGPSTAALGSGGEGTSSFSIALATGEGITTPRTFTRIRRCALVDYFRII
ncbi:MAG TPA: aldehyde dehydrogenase EutE [Candidatus Latescibacteria bacterium]|nr:aldehyde dehydrogenase EutE [Candidatus Latescibacterota bacterium]HPC44208.1 aldehyde dehydrogenase EutE [Candidatus Latescibacterota bacterium]HQE61866.1 aldehyde dehydrogenase EutE [Candidatus Latescibacterota bacterium]HQI76058.1 aldehyde dehydrogenase EutE [Candidatus Latescibacterota bacterium]HQK21835.1 aldehyde dehydrogenase EutE [Candidatus Latescibacterota bacterium]